MIAVAIVSALIAVYCMLRAHRAASERDAIAAELDQAHAAGAVLVVERNRALSDRDAHAARAVELSRRVTELEVERDGRDRSIEALAARVAEVMRERDSALGLVEVAAGASPGDEFMRRGRKP